MGGRGSNSKLESSKNRELATPGNAEPVIRFAKTAPAAGLSDIKAKYRDDVQYLFMHESADTVYLDNIVVKVQNRGKGVGQRILDDIIGYADRNGKRVALTPTSEFGTQKRLEKWYKKNGFVKNSGRNADYSLNETMYRNPKKGL